MSLAILACSFLLGLLCSRRMTIVGIAFIAFLAMVLATVSLAGRYGVAAAVGYGLLVMVVIQLGYATTVAIAAFLPLSSKRPGGQARRSRSTRLSKFRE